MGTNLSTEAIVISIYGGTSWTQITDRFLIGASSTYAAKATGGSTTHTITTSEMPSHTHTGPSHTHTLTAAGSVSVKTNPTFTGSQGTTSSAGSHSHTGSSNWVKSYNTDGSEANRLYYAGGGGSTPSAAITNSTGSHTHTLTPSGSISGGAYTFTGSSATSSSSGTGNTGSTGSGSAMSILNPYYAVYIWVRTA